MAKAKDYVNNIVDTLGAVITAGANFSTPVDLGGAAPAKVLIPGPITTATELRFEIGYLNNSTNQIDFLKLVDFTGTDVVQQIEGFMAFSPNPASFFGAQYLRFVMSPVEAVDINLVIIPRSI